MIGDLISAGAKLIGGFMDSKNADKNRELQQQQMKQQLDFAQSGIQWKVADAKAAGIHPLFALGANTHSYAPISVGSTDAGWGKTLSGMGQDIGRAVTATASEPTRASMFDNTVKAMTLENMGLDLDIKKADLMSRVMRIKQQTGPAIPEAGQPFKPAEGKPDDYPAFMLGGRRMLPPSGSSPMKTGEDWAGDEGSWAFLPAWFWDFVQTNWGSQGYPADRIASRAQDTHKLRWENARQHRERSDYYLFR